MIEPHCDLRVQDEAWRSVFFERAWGGRFIPAQLLHIDPGAPITSQHVTAK